MPIDLTSIRTCPRSSGAPDRPRAAEVARPREEASPSDGFDRAAFASRWLCFAGVPKKTVAPKVMQGRASGTPPADLGPGTSLPEAIFRRADALKADEAHAPIRSLYAEAEAFAKRGEYGKAAEKLDRALSRYETEIDASEAMGNGGVAGTRSLVRQYEFMDAMKARGVTTSHPPTKKELVKYFDTFDSKKDRPKALAAFSEYSKAFHVHPADVGRPEEDTTYSKDPIKYAVGKKLYDTEAAAEKAQKKEGGTLYEFPTADASSWKDVTDDRELVGLEGGHAHAAGRRVIDCEGYAYLARELLGASGYRTQQVAVQSTDGKQHAMVLLTDPSKKSSVSVVSNAETFTAAKKMDALRAGFTDAMPEGAVAGRYFYGKSQHEAQVKMLNHYRDAEEVAD